MRELLGPAGNRHDVASVPSPSKIGRISLRVSVIGADLLEAVREIVTIDTPSFAASRPGGVEDGVAPT